MEGMCQKCAQSTTRPCSIYLVLLGPPVSQSLGSARETHHPKETPTIEVAGRSSLIPVICPHGPLPGLSGFGGGSSSNENLPPGVGTLRVRENVPMHRVIRKMSNLGARLAACKLAWLWGLARKEDVCRQPMARDRKDRSKCDDCWQSNMVLTFCIYIHGGSPRFC